MSRELIYLLPCRATVDLQLLDSGYCMDSLFVVLRATQSMNFSLTLTLTPLHNSEHRARAIGPACPALGLETGLGLVLTLVQIGDNPRVTEEREGEGLRLAGAQSPFRTLGLQSLGRASSLGYGTCQRRNTTHSNWGIRCI